ncbi:MAG TPA: hypothetical protein VK201_09290 [bacterium]|nr:hypothetical protein [bacterium]
MGSVWLENRTKSRSRENNWYLLWRQGGRDSKKFHRRLGNVASHVATEEKHRKVTELARGETCYQAARIHKLSFKEFINQFWLPDRDVESTTAALTKLRLEKYILPTLGNKSIETITRQDVRVFLRTIYDPQTKTGKMTTARQVCRGSEGTVQLGRRGGTLVQEPSRAQTGAELAQAVSAHGALVGR